jgi:recombinational DNA repair protein (RecF pathway)
VRSLRKITTQLRLANMLYNAPVRHALHRFLCAITKRSEPPQNMSFRSNGVDCVRSLRKITMQLRLANMLYNAPVRHVLHRFLCAMTKRSEPPQNMSFRSNGEDCVRSLRKITTQLRLANMLCSAPVRHVSH